MLKHKYVVSVKQTQNICITFIQRRPNVFDAGPTLYKCYTNFSVGWVTTHLLSYILKGENIHMCANLSENITRSIIDPYPH